MVRNHTVDTQIMNMIRSGSSPTKMVKADDKVCAHIRTHSHTHAHARAHACSRLCVVEKLNYEEARCSSTQDWKTWNRLCLRIATAWKRCWEAGHLDGSVGWAPNFGSGQDLAVHEFKPRAGLCAHRLESGARFGFCLPLSLTIPHLYSVCLSLSLSLKYK